MREFAIRCIFVHLSFVSLGETSVKHAIYIHLLAETFVV
jgi:hypothetical protein